MTSSPERGARVCVPPPLVFLGCMLSALAMQRFVIPLGFDGGRPITTIAGIALILAGAASIVTARILFLRTGQSPMPWTPTPELIVRGPYRLTRNPMYVGITTLLIGLGIAVDVLWISVLAVAALAIVHVVAVAREEAYLAAKFGDAYTAYVARVRRYI